jgi:hypothetical protein
MEQHFNLLIAVYNTPTYLFFHSKLSFVQYVMKKEIQICKSHFNLFECIMVDIDEVVFVTPYEIISIVNYH